MSSAAPPINAAASDAAPRKGGRKKLILIAIPLLLAAVGGGLWFGGVLPPLVGMGPAPATAKATAPGAATAQAEPKAKAPVFMDLPDLVANLNVGQRRSSFIKLKARIEIARTEDQPVIAAAMPRLQDLFTTYLREMRPDELRGSAGTYRLREELLARANIAVFPARVVDVLFTEMLIQ